MPDAAYDLFIIGGGVNGCGIARDAAGRGLSVMLCEQGDLAQGTSSASTKLFHGGLRYLEHYEFRLVRESLIERETLLKAMPHISWPLRFILPHHRGLRPAWLLRLGLFIYDHLGGRKLLPPTKVLDLPDDPAGAPLKTDYRQAFEYSDCWVEDSRLVVLNAQDAAERGAAIRTGSRCVAATAGEDGWTITVQDVETGAQETVQARALINAGGPWADGVITGALRRNESPRTRLVRGSHIVTKKLFDHDRAYILQNSDKRIVFMIPYEQDFTLVGTTDADHDGAPGDAVCTPEEADYLRTVASEYLKTPISAEDVVWTYSGVRPLYNDGAGAASAATRDYVLDLEEGAAPLLNIFGGKITTYRRLAEAALAKLAKTFPQAKPAWTAGAPMPGGDFPVDQFEARVHALRQSHPALDERWARRLIRAYGTNAERAIDHGRFGEDFGATLCEAELRYLMDVEWARTAEDVLWRRSKLGLRMTVEQRERLEHWMRDRRAALKEAA